MTESHNDITTPPIPEERPESQTTAPESVESPQVTAQETQSAPVPAAQPQATTPSDSAPSDTESAPHSPATVPGSDETTDSAPETDSTAAAAKPETAAATPPKSSRVAAPVPEVDDAAAAAAAKWGRVDDEGNVWLRSSGSDGERIVGQYAVDGTEKDALGLYVRRYLDLENHVTLLESRVNNVSPDEIASSIKSLNKQLVEPAVVGDVEALRLRVKALEGRLAQRREEVKAERAAAKAAAIEERTTIVENAEKIAAQDPARTHWKNSRAALNDLLDEWKYAQRHSARIDRPTEEALWKRFSSARTTFDRHRRQFFSQKDAERKDIVARKEAIIARAEAIQDSTDWGATSAQFRELMAEWKAAGRTHKRDDDALWSRFSAAQNHFYDTRNAYNTQLDEEFEANRSKKLELLEEAEKLLPVTDIAYAKEQIRAIGEKWDAIGRVPRADVARTEGRLREIETIIRNAENERWNQSDPQKDERSAGMAAQLQKLIDELETQISEAKAAGDDKKVKEYEEALQARKTWLSAVQEG
ncbi:DUF349 domain-containing protein [Trueperella sp. LYQ143]|uniref:DUF349 domain-containing protein n=1 Tax=unclassified Trueperella TaxID=2630174 RepID=UPI0039831FC6